MRHPGSRSERRYAREVWRNYRRRLVFTLWNHSSSKSDPTQNLVWWHGGKQCFACGNRCMHAMLERYSDHQEVKRLRRELFKEE